MGLSSWKSLQDERYAGVWPASMREKFLGSYPGKNWLTGLETRINEGTFHDTEVKPRGGTQHHLSMARLMGASSLSWVTVSRAHLKCLYTVTQSMKNKQNELWSLSRAAILLSVLVRLGGKSPTAGVLGWRAIGYSGGKAGPARWRCWTVCTEQMHILRSLVLNLP